VSKALRELTERGLYRVATTRRPDGTLLTEAHVYAAPHLPGAEADPAAVQPPEPAAPKPPAPEPKNPGTGKPGGIFKKWKGGRNKNPLPTRPITGTPDDRSSAPPPPPPSAALREAAATLHRAIAPDRRLRLGAAEGFALAPLVAEWLARGYGERDLAAALLLGLPDYVYGDFLGDLENAAHQNSVTSRPSRRMSSSDSLSVKATFMLPYPVRSMRTMKS